MLHHHINALDVERLDDYSSIELEQRLTDIVHRIQHLETMLAEATEMATQISKRISDHRLHATHIEIERQKTHAIDAEAQALEQFYNGL